jgi:hypothetical protein
MYGFNTHQKSWSFIKARIRIRPKKVRICNTAVDQGCNTQTPNPHQCMILSSYSDIFIQYLQVPSVFAKGDRSGPVPGYRIAYSQFSFMAKWRIFLIYLRAGCVRDTSSGMHSQISFLKSNIYYIV